ncbi:hypothetical protein JD844_017648 [Phrynosoma platyrhinos]|uniref:LIM zinc-binding domain-containing protein n=1 Tax=Phrynosoma platyrhinos TaxID=52577 RepID=A0ABQ7SMC5_PHRPL|nr:hypothetical protein JD844_017648 [Phrynosoma platyrhinos]
MIKDGLQISTHLFIYNRMLEEQNSSASFDCESNTDFLWIYRRNVEWESPSPVSLIGVDPEPTMVNPGSSSQPPPVTSGSLSWKRCAGCGGKIADRFLLYAMDSYWHSRCLKCSCCQAQLGEIGTSCYTKSGMILCRNDYISFGAGNENNLRSQVPIGSFQGEVTSSDFLVFRLFGNSGACSACGQSIPASELVMRAQGNVYHLKCFTCSTCRNRLVPGDRFHYINGSLFCEHDRPTALINGHLNSLQSNPLLPDQKRENVIADVWYQDGLASNYFHMAPKSKQKTVEDLKFEYMVDMKKEHTRCMPSLLVRLSHKKIYYS